MAELVVLGVVGGKKLIDNHFDRIPNGTFAKETYNPRRLRNLRRRRRPVAAEPHSDSGETDSDSGLDEQDPPMDRQVETARASVLPAPPLSAPRPRQDYEETRRRSVQVAPVPVSYHDVEVEPRGRPVVYYVDDGPSRPRRPVIVTRRSSSYHGPRDRYPRYQAVEERQYVRRPRDAYVGDMLSRGVDDRQLMVRGIDDRQLVAQSTRAVDDRQLVLQSRKEEDRKSQRGSRRGTSPENNDQKTPAMRRRRRQSETDPSSQQQQKRQNPEGIRPELGDFFSRSGTGILGGVVGAAAGAWFTHQAQIATGVEKKGPAAKTAMTLLGAAVGGLTLNAVVDKWEDENEDTAEKEQNWDQEWNYPDDSQDVGKKKGRRDRDRGD